MNRKRCNDMRHASAISWPSAVTVALLAGLCAAGCSDSEVQVASPTATPAVALITLGSVLAVCSASVGAAAGVVSAKERSAVACSTASSTCCAPSSG